MPPNAGAARPRPATHQPTHASTPTHPPTHPHNHHLPINIHPPCPTALPHHAAPLHRTASAGYTACASFTEARDVGMSCAWAPGRGAGLLASAHQDGTLCIFDMRCGGLGAGLGGGLGGGLARRPARGWDFWGLGGLSCRSGRGCEARPYGRRHSSSSGGSSRRAIAGHALGRDGGAVPRAGACRGDGGCLLLLLLLLHWLPDADAGAATNNQYLPPIGRILVSQPGPTPPDEGTYIYIWMDLREMCLLCLLQRDQLLHVASRCLTLPPPPRPQPHSPPNPPSRLRLLPPLQDRRYKSTACTVLAGTSSLHQGGCWTCWRHRSTATLST